MWVGNSTETISPGCIMVDLNAPLTVMTGAPFSVLWSMFLASLCASALVFIPGTSFFNVLTSSEFAPLLASDFILSMSLIMTKALSFAADESPTTMISFGASSILLTVMSSMPFAIPRTFPLWLKESDE